MKKCLGLYRFLATEKCESYQHIKEKRDRVLGGGQTLLFLLQPGGGGSKGTGWNNIYIAKKS